MNDSAQRRQIEELVRTVMERGTQVLTGLDPDTRREVELLLAERATESGLDITRWNTADADSVDIGAVLGPYRIESRLGRGGMGEVFRATDTRLLHRQVALKVCAGKFSERFEREAQAISRLSHPNICTLHDIGPNYLVMELIEGPTLAAWLREQRMVFSEVARLGMQIADALTEAHGRDVVHRDLKPSNVMVTRHGVKVLDFGLAKLASESVVELTKTHTVMGTPAFMAPEQVEGKPADARTDLFALGLILYEMAAGQLPFPGASLGTMLTSSHVVIPPPSKLRPGIPAWFDALIARLLSKDPEARPQSAAEVREALGQLDSRRRPMGVRRLAIAAALVALSASIWLGYRWLTPGERIVRTISSTPVTTWSGIENDPFFSPDGKELVFVADDAGPKIFRTVVGSQTRRRMTEGTGIERFPIWSPDGNQIAYLLQTGENRWGVAVVPAAGGPSRMLGSVQFSSTQEFYGTPAWTPDSRNLVVVTQNGANRGVLALISVETGAMQILDIPILYGDGLSRGQPDLTSPSVSPDGKWLAYADGGQVMAIALGPAYLPQASPVTAPLKTISGVHFAWLGERVIFSYTDTLTDSKLAEWDLKEFHSSFWVGLPLLGAITLSAVEGRVRIVGPQGSTLPQLVLRPFDPVKLAFGPDVQWPRSPRADNWPSYSPDGKQIAFGTNRTGKVETWVADPRGGNQRQFSLPVPARQPAWSPDGHRIAFSRGPDGELMILDTSSGIATDLPNHPKGEYPQWSLDGNYLYVLDTTGNEQLSRVRVADGAVESIGRGVRAQETPDGKSLVISRPRDGLYSRALKENLAESPETLLVKDSPEAIVVRQRGIYYVAAADSPGSIGSLRLYDFASHRRHDLGPVFATFTPAFAVSPDEREIVLPIVGMELDLMMFEFESTP